MFHVKHFIFEYCRKAGKNAGLGRLKNQKNAKNQMKKGAEEP